MPDVVLLHMPFAAVERPSLGLGLLQAALTQHNITSLVLYPNLDFAEEVGLARYRLAEMTRNDDLLGEWVFASAAFRDQAPPDREYLARVDLTPAQRRLGKRDPILEAFAALRAAAPAYIDRVARSVLARQPRVVGASSTFQQHCASLAVLRRIRELAPEVQTMLGGANCEGVMGRATFEAFPWLDYVVGGEADEIIVGLVRSLLEREVPVLEGVWGPAHRSCEPTAAAPRPVVQNLESLPMPCFDSYFQRLQESSLSSQIHPGLLLENSRGCWWGQKHHCTFCGLNGVGMAFRAKSAERTLCELAQLSERHGLNRFELTDNILAQERFRDLLPSLAARQAPYSLFAEVKANLKREQLEALARAGVRWVQPGLESLHDEVLKLMDKGTTTAVNLQHLKWAREFGIFISWNFLCGFPGERDEWYQEMAGWLELVEHLQPPTGVFRLRFDRYSPYQVDPSRYGLDLVAHPAYAAIYPVEPRLLADLAYFFVDAPTERDWGPASWAPEQLGPGHAAVEQISRRWARAFWSPLPPILSLTDDGQHLRLLDTRSCARERRRVLTGLPRSLYLACEQARGERACAQALGVEVEEVRAALSELCEARVMLQLADGRYLALAVGGEMPRLPRPAEFPGGTCKIAPGLG